MTILQEAKNIAESLPQQQYPLYQLQAARMLLEGAEARDATWASRLNALDAAIRAELTT